jgi:hypothetical protein
MRIHQRPSSNSGRGFLSHKKSIFEGLINLRL